MTPRRPPHESLMTMLSAVARQDAPGLMAEARAGARARARAIIEDALVEQLVEAAGRAPTEEELEPAPRPATPAPRPEVETRRADGMEQRRDGEAYWTYCVLAASEADGLPNLPEGVESGTWVEAVRQGELAALISRVPLAHYEDAPLREHLNDVTWVERTARAHERVLEHAHSCAPIVPLRLCTLYRDRDGVRRLLADEAGELKRNLAEVKGRAEWGVKLFVDRERLEAALAEHSGAEEHVEDPGTGDPTSGEAGQRRAGSGYLARKQQERAVAARSESAALQRAQDVHAQVEEVSVAARANPLQRPEAHGRPTEMVFNGVYLVDRERESKLRAVLASCQPALDEAGLELELTGPWPPYNFVSFSGPVGS